MYSSLQITNFRGLLALSVEDLGRLNLFVGPNNVGKTSLLEAMMLLQYPANPAATVALALSRGFPPPQQAPGSLWHPLFSGLDTNRRIEIAGARSDGVDESLSIGLTKGGVGELDGLSNGEPHAPLATVLAGNMATPPETLTYRFVRGNHPPVGASFSLGLGRAAVRADPQFTETPELAARPSIFLPARHRSTPEELAARYTTLQDTVGGQALVRVLAALEPGLESLSIGFDLGTRQPSLRAHIDGLAVPVPLQLLGEGVGRLADILLAIPTIPDGLLLVDEIENGLYYRNMEAAWRAIDAASRDVNAQLLATTHSAECVQAAVQALAGESAADFRLYRLERTKEGVRPVRFDHATARAALDFDLEFR